MAVLKSLSGYKPFYLQGASDTTAKDSLATWGLMVKSIPFKALPEPKEPYSNDWHDEHGDDEYNDKMFYAAYTMDVTFLLVADSQEEIVSSLRTFFAHVQQGEFMIYDDFTKIGRQCVRYAGFTDNAYKFRDGDKCYLEFTVTFKVNDPVTFITLDTSSNKLEVAS